MGKGAPRPYLEARERSCVPGPPTLYALSPARLVVSPLSGAVALGTGKSNAANAARVDVASASVSVRCRSLGELLRSQRLHCLRWAVWPLYCVGQQ
jgi:hypothetical protein